MSDKKCCVPGCAENKGSHKTWHGFPNPVTDSERFRTWVYAVGGDILKLKNEYIYKYRCVCHAHFEERFCCRFNKISNIATPTLHMPDDYSLFSEKKVTSLFSRKRRRTEF
ncbi:uncharacterized protein [Choristoneura fumiferana]|uniref:uncharacterized protein n=1 Tax=Choristoneura fumiferana TaxID=7141 RepID=UPI003D1539B0